MDNRLKIIFWGEDSFSDVVLASLIKAGHNVLGVITPYYADLKYKRLEITCKKHDIFFRRFVKINSNEVYETVRDLNPDLCVVAHFEKLISPELLSIPRMGFINLHPSLLPFYRGMAPQHWPLINGEKETGISVHYIDEGIDTGAIIIQKRIPLTSDMYVADLQNKWLAMYQYVVVEAIDRMLKGEEVLEQKKLKGSYYGKLKYEQCKLSIDMSVVDAYNLIRGVSLPYCGAVYNNIIIYRAHISHEEKILSWLKDKNNGLYEGTPYGVLLKFKDGILIIDKSKKI